MGFPTFSLIIPTLGRDNELRTLLNSVSAQTFSDFEVIVIDQNEDDRLNGIISSFASRLSIRHVRQKERGASLARNIGIDNAKGSIITFPDDDAEYPNDLLQRVNEILAKDKTLAGITCASQARDGKGSVTRMSTKGGPITKLNILTKIVEFTIFFRADVLKGFRFDENFGPGAKTGWWCDEGPDLLLRLMSNGARFEFHPEMIVYHADPKADYNEKVFTRSRNYGLARGKFLRKHHYPFWYVAYIWMLYVAGICIGLAQFNLGKMKYYFSGLVGRIRGYVS